MIIEYNETNIFDLVRVLRVIMRQILLYDEYLDTNDRYMTKVVSSKNLVSYEKGSKYYKFNYRNTCSRNWINIFKFIFFRKYFCNNKKSFI